MNSFLWSDGDPSPRAFPLKGGAQSKPVSCMVVLFYTFRARGEMKTSTFSLPQINRLPYSSRPLETEAPFKKKKEKRILKKKREKKRQKEKKKQLNRKRRKGTKKEKEKRAVPEGAGEH